jgi:hypothetical protein
MKNKFTLLITILSFSLLSCANDFQYNKAYLSDEDMELGTTSVQSTEISSTSYREGAAGANGGKTGGGCGCN